MERIDTPTAEPNQNGLGKAGFVDGDAGKRVLATRISVDWLNTIQEELANVIEQTGQDLNGDVNDQLVKSLEEIFESSRQGISSAQSRNASSRPDFIRAAGNALSATIVASPANPLAIKAGELSETHTANINLGRLTGSVGSNSRNARFSQIINLGPVTGEIGNVEFNTIPDGVIPINTSGTEIIARQGKLAAFKITQSSKTEYFLAKIQHSGQLSQVRRRYFLKSDGNPVDNISGPVSGISQIKLMELLHVMRDLTNKEFLALPSTKINESDTMPSSPADGDLWRDSKSGSWHRYSSTGGVFNLIDLVPLGHLVVDVDSGHCVASRSFELSRSYSNLNNITLDLDVSTVSIRLKNSYRSASVYGRTVNFLNYAVWNNTNLVRGESLGVDTKYTVYLSDTGQRIISAVESQYSKELLGWYHPFESWRAVGEYWTGSSRFFTEAKNWYPYQRFHNYENIPVFDSYIRSASITDETIEAHGRLIESVERRGVGVYLWHLREGILGAQVTSAAIAGANEIFLSLRTRQDDPGSIELRCEENRNNAGPRRIDSSHTMILTRSGLDLKQVERWNQLKK